MVSPPSSWVRARVTASSSVPRSSGLSDEPADDRVAVETTDEGVGALVALHVVVGGACVDVVVAALAEEAVGVVAAGHHIGSGRADGAGLVGAHDHARPEQGMGDPPVVAQHDVGAVTGVDLVAAAVQQTGRGAVERRRQEVDQSRAGAAQRATVRAGGTAEEVVVALSPGEDVGSVVALEVVLGVAAVEVVATALTEEAVARPVSAQPVATAGGRGRGPRSWWPRRAAGGRTAAPRCSGRSELPTRVARALSPASRSDAVEPVGSSVTADDVGCVGHAGSVAVGGEPGTPTGVERGATDDDVVAVVAVGDVRARPGLDEVVSPCRLGPGRRRSSRPRGRSRRRRTARRTPSGCRATRPVHRPCRRR